MAQNILVPVLNFLSRHGDSALYEVIHKLNSGITATSVAAQFRISKSQFSEFIGNTFVRSYALKPEVAQLLRALEEDRRQRIATGTLDPLPDRLLQTYPSPLRALVGDLHFVPCKPPLKREAR